MRLRKGIFDHMRRNKRLRKQVATLREQLAEAKKLREIVCAGCGKGYIGKRDDDDWIEEAAAHITKCPKHPYAKLREQLATAKTDGRTEALDDIEAELDASSPQQIRDIISMVRRPAEQPNPSRPRDWPEDFPHDNGMYMCKCSVCGEQFTGHKRRVVCKVCANKPKPKPCKNCGGRKSVLFGDVDRMAGTPRPKTRRLACFNDLYHTEEYECPDCQPAPDDAIDRKGE